MSASTADADHSLQHEGAPTNRACAPAFSHSSDSALPPSHLVIRDPLPAHPRISVKNRSRFSVRDNNPKRKYSPYPVLTKA
jgi:hypothetical protein